MKDGGAGDACSRPIASASGLRFAGDGYIVDVLASGDAPVVDAQEGSLTWALSVDPHGSCTVTVEVEVRRNRWATSTRSHPPVR